MACRVSANYWMKVMLRAGNPLNRKLATNEQTIDCSHGNKHMISSVNPHLFDPNLLLTMSASIIERSKVRSRHEFLYLFHFSCIAARCTFFFFVLLRIWIYQAVWYLLLLSQVFTVRRRGCIWICYLTNSHIKITDKSTLKRLRKVLQ